METPRRTHRMCRQVFCATMLLLMPTFTLKTFGQESVAPEPQAVPAPNASSDSAPREEPVDLRTLVIQEQRNVPQSQREAGESVLSIRGNGDGSVEVRDVDGNLLEAYPPNYFTVSGKVKAEAIGKLNSTLEAQKQALEERKGQEQEQSKKALDAAREAEETKKQEESANEAKWNEDFASKSTGYIDKKTRAELKAVKIDAREIREDGTFLYEGKALKPVRLWNTQRNRYEMAIPVPPPAE